MRNRIRMSVGLALIILSMLVLGGVAAAQSFTADVFVHADKQTMQGKIYITTGKMRYESAGTIAITRMDKSLVWILMPTEKMYMEQTIKLQNIIPGSDKVPGEIERTFLGQETINGYLSNKYHITLKIDNKNSSYFEWLTVGTQLPVKMTDEKGTWITEYRNITTANCADSLFELPPGYQKFGMSMNF